MAAPSRVGSPIEILDQQIREAIDAGDVTRYRVLVAEKAELVPGIGPVKVTAVVSVVRATGQPFADRDSVQVLLSSVVRPFLPAYKRVSPIRLLTVSTVDFMK
jgi:hypothetical protein